MGKLSRTKGHSFERDTARWFREIGWVAQRGIQSRKGDEAPDVIADCGRFSLSVECKHRKRLDVTGAIAQAKENADGGNWAVRMKPHGGKPFWVFSDEFAAVLLARRGVE